MYEWQMGRFLKCFRKEFTGGYTAYNRDTTVQDLKNRVFPIFTDFSFSPDKGLSADTTDPQIVGIFFQNSLRNTIDEGSAQAQQVSSRRLEAR
jgi:hypothetical protein